LSISPLAGAARPGFIANPSRCWQIVYSVAAPSDDPLRESPTWKGPVVLAEG
jgi:hypothetical protein